MPPKKKKAPADRRVSSGKYMESSEARVSKCRRCGSVVAAGQAEGIKMQMDLVTLTPQQVAVCMLTQTPVYAMGYKGVIEVHWWRMPWTRGAVFPEHRCGVKWPQEMPLSTRPPSADTDIPPY